MRIIGRDLHARGRGSQCWTTTTGEVVNTTLKHEGSMVESLCQPSTAGASGNRSHGIDAVVFQKRSLLSGLGLVSTPRVPLIGPI